MRRNALSGSVLGGLRVSPYACDFGALWLQIRATVRITARKGQAFEAITDKAMNSATNVSQTNLIWKWTTECSPQLTRSHGSPK